MAIPDMHISFFISHGGDVGHVNAILRLGMIIDPLNKSSTHWGNFKLLTAELVSFKSLQLTACFVIDLFRISV
jgi:hypothetical protein